MAGIPFKGGFNPVGLNGSAKFTGAIRVYQTSVSAGAIFSGDPVFLTANGKVIAGVAPTSTTNVIGVALGGFYIDPVSEQPVETKFIPANTASGNGNYNGINFTADQGPGVKVVAKDQLFAVKANASVPSTAIGDRLEVVNSAGSTTTGQSGATVSVAGAVTDIAVVEDVFRTSEYATPSSAGGTAVNDWNAPETVIIVSLRNNEE